MNKQIMKDAGFADEVAMVEEGLCPCCHELINLKSFRDPISRKEYQISGMCQNCQDKVFGK